MAKNKKKKNRNELSIFEDFRLKPPSNLRKTPKKSDLKNVDIFKYHNHKLKKDTYWMIAKSGYILQVDKSGRLILSSHNDYQKNTPVKSNLKKSHFKPNVKAEIDKKSGKPIAWWSEDKNGELFQVNYKKIDASIEFKIKAWLRNKAIDAVSLEIRTMKKNAYEYSEDELMRMIEAEENKIIKKGGWRAVRVAALSTLGLPFLGFL